MSAAFVFRDLACWGSNGTIELYLERLGQLATESPGTDPRIQEWLVRNRESFYMGAVLSLDALLIDRAATEQFLGLFDRVTAEFLAGGTFTEVGRRWLCSEPPKLRERLGVAASGMA